MNKNTHEYYMRQALDLAEDGLGKTAPNPSVGCVIVKNDTIIAEARTSNGGRPHAEVNALSITGNEADGATLYVTLEPCNTHGQTGPCVEAIINAKIKCVVIGCSDPYQNKERSNGIQKLKEAGIEVIENICRDEAVETNKGFFMSVQKNRPYVTVKIATSLDGKVATATGHSKWITSEQSRARVHEIRAAHDGILTGSGTLLADDPQLNVRLPGYDGPQPKRFVLNESQKIQDNAKMLNDAEQNPVYFISSQKPKDDLVKQGVQFIEASHEGGSFNLGNVLQKIKDEDITRLMIEAGPKTVTSFIKAGLVDELLWFKAPILIGDDGIDAFAGLGIAQVSEALNLTLTEATAIGDDMFEKWCF